MNAVENTTVLQFLVDADCMPVFEHRSKIERLFSVQLILDIPSPTANTHWVGVKGDPRDRLNAKIYILSLVKCPNSVCAEEKKIYLPPEVSADVIESVERRTTAAIIPSSREKNIYSVLGSSLSVSAAITAIQEIVGSSLVPLSGYCTPKRSNRASRKLSCALQETLTKTNQKGNYVNASDAVKRAIASCLLEDTDDKPAADDSIILIDGDSDEESETILIESSEYSDDDDDNDDDVIIIESPKLSKSQTDHSDDVFFSDDFREKTTETNKAVEKLTEAFRDMSTPSRCANKSVNQHYKAKAEVKPLNFTDLMKEVSVESQKNISGLRTEGKVTCDKRSDEKAKRKQNKREKRKKKRTASKLDDSMEVLSKKDNSVTSHKNIHVTAEKQSEFKRQRIKSVVTKPSKSSEMQLKDKGKVDLLLKKGEKSSDRDTRKIKVKGKEKSQDYVKDHDREKRVVNQIENLTKKHALLFGTVEFVDDSGKDASRENKTRAVADKQIYNSSAIQRIPSLNRCGDLRYIVIDGSNVAMTHGQDKFSCKGIRLCVEYFQNRGHTMITVFLPHWRKCRPRDPNSVTHRYILDDLEKEGFLVYTPSRRIGNKLVASYDDRYIIELAEREDAVVVSNDQYRDLLHEKHSWRRVIETSLLMYTFVRDHFMPPDDPYGKRGPTLDELLRHPKNKPARDLDTYFVLKQLEHSRPDYDRRDAERDYYSYRASRY